MTGSNTFMQRRLFSIYFEFWLVQLIVCYLWLVRVLQIERECKNQQLQQQIFCTHQKNK